MKKELLSLNRKTEICAALKQLMKRKSIQKITIQELADECGISRYTFYYHFTDIYDCLSWSLQEGLRELGQNMDSQNDTIALIVQNVEDNKSIYKYLLNSPRPDLLHSIFHQEVRSLVHLYLSNFMKRFRYVTSNLYLSFLIDYFTSTLEGLLFILIQENPNHSDPLLMEYLHTVLGGELEGIVKRAEQRGFCTKGDRALIVQPQLLPDAWNHLL